MIGEKLNGLDLFSGIGGIGIALNEWVRTVAYCEQDRYAQGVLLSRMQSGDIDRAPIWNDVRTLTQRLLPTIDIIFGGFPCQDISVAGAGKGLDGERSGLFFEIIRLAKEIGPSFVFLENVPAIRTRGLEQVIKAFAEIGYDCRWTTLSAASIGAPHKRERWFLLAYADRANLRLESGRISWQDGQKTFELGINGEQKSLADSNSIWKQSEQENRKHSSDRISDGGQNVANSECERLAIRPREKQQGIFRIKFKNRETVCQWAIEPDVGRVVNGLPHRMDRIKCLGNSVVPAQVKTAFEKLVGAA